VLLGTTADSADGADTIPDTRRQTVIGRLFSQANLSTATGRDHLRFHAIGVTAIAWHRPCGKACAQRGAPVRLSRARRPGFGSTTPRDWSARASSK